VRSDWGLRQIGILVYWYIGILVYWYTGIFVCLGLGVGLIVDEGVRAEELIFRRVKGMAGFWLWGNGVITMVSVF